MMNKMKLQFDEKEFFFLINEYKKLKKIEQRYYTTFNINNLKIVARAEFKLRTHLINWPHSIYTTFLFWYCPVKSNHCVTELEKYFAIEICEAMKEKLTETEYGQLTIKSKIVNNCLYNAMIQTPEIKELIEKTRKYTKKTNRYINKKLTPQIKKWEDETGYSACLIFDVACSKKNKTIKTIQKMLPDYKIGKCIEYK